MKLIEEKNYSRFENALSDLINTFSMESGSDTPDYILARYLTECLKTFNRISHLKKDREVIK